MRNGAPLDPQILQQYAVTTVCIKAEVHISSTGNRQRQGACGDMLRSAAAGRCCGAAAAAAATTGLEERW